jgi:hypothetical protein
MIWGQSDRVQFAAKLLKEQGSTVCCHPQQGFTASKIALSRAAPASAATAASHCTPPFIHLHYNRQPLRENGAPQRGSRGLHDTMLDGHGPLSQIELIYLRHINRKGDNSAYCKSNIGRQGVVVSVSKGLPNAAAAANSGIEMVGKACNVHSSHGNE